MALGESTKPITESDVVELIELKIDVLVLFLVNVSSNYSEADIAFNWLTACSFPLATASFNNCALFSSDTYKFNN